jgi:hypothetical protein
LGCDAWDATVKVKARLKKRAPPGSDGSGPVVAVVGSRKFLRWSQLYRVLDHVRRDNPNLMVISGGAEGADTYAEQWAKLREIPFRQYPANWERYGKKAGYMRNLDIVANATWVIAFWDGESRGTKHTIDLTREARKPLTIIDC